MFLIGRNSHVHQEKNLSIGEPQSCSHEMKKKTKKTQKTRGKEKPLDNSQSKQRHQQQL